MFQGYEWDIIDAFTFNWEQIILGKLELNQRQHVVPVPEMTYMMLVTRSCERERGSRSRNSAMSTRLPLTRYELQRNTGICNARVRLLMGFPWLSQRCGCAPFFSDPDPTQYLDMFDVWQKKSVYGILLPNLMTLKSKIKNIVGRNCILDNFISRANLSYRGLLVYKGFGSGIFPDPDLGDPKRPDLTRSGSATLIHVATNSFGNTMDFWSTGSLL